MLALDDSGGVGVGTVLATLFSLALCVGSGLLAYRGYVVHAIGLGFLAATVAGAIWAMHRQARGFSIDTWNGRVRTWSNNPLSQDRHEAPLRGFTSVLVKPVYSLAAMAVRQRDMRVLTLEVDVGHDSEFAVFLCGRAGEMQLIVRADARVIAREVADFTGLPLDDRTWGSLGADGDGS